MLNWILSWFLKKEKEPEPEYGTGALLDPRADEDKLDDVDFSDVVRMWRPESLGGVKLINWEEKSREKWRTFPIRDQGKGFTCMANAYAKMLGVLSLLRDGEFITYSAAHIYQRRANKPSAGMALYDVMKIGSDGVTLEALVPSEQLSDIEISNIKVEPHEAKVGEVFAIDDTPINIPIGDFDTCASVIQTTGKAIVSMFYFTAEEWGQLVPTIKETWAKADDPKFLRHGVALVDVFLFNGVEVIRAEDSAHFGQISERLLTREFFTKRNFGSGYTMRFKFDVGAGERPIFKGTIISAQECLRWEGFFPTNISFIENLGPVTREALRKFQTKYGIDPVGNLGPQTKLKLAELYS